MRIGNAYGGCGGSSRLLHLGHGTKDNAQQGQGGDPHDAFFAVGRQYVSNRSDDDGVDAAHPPPLPPLPRVELYQLVPPSSPRVLLPLADHWAASVSGSK